MKGAQGGLGILNLIIHNQALLMKNLHKFYNHASIPWVNLVWHAYYDNRGTPQSINTKASFCWKDCIALEDKYKEMTYVDIQNGKIVLLWKDNWNNGIRQDIYIYPHLHSFAKTHNITIDKTIEETNDNIYDIFHLHLIIVSHENSIIWNRNSWN
jgi:hypothetical protein